MKNIFGRMFSGLEADLTYRTMRQNLLSANIANLDTPNYTPHDMSFQHLVKDIIEPPKKSDNQQVENAVATVGDPDFVPVESTPGIDGNKVDMERQIAFMTENSLEYQATAKLMSKKMAMLKYAINER